MQTVKESSMQREMTDLASGAADGISKLISVNVNERHVTQRHGIIAEWQQSTRHC